MKGIHASKETVVIFVGSYSMRKALGERARRRNIIDGFSSWVASSGSP